MVSPLEFSRLRDKRIFDILDVAPVTLKQLVKLGVFPSYNVAARASVKRSCHFWLSDSYSAGECQVSRTDRTVCIVFSAME